MNFNRFESVYKMRILILFILISWCIVAGIVMLIQKTVSKDTPVIQTIQTRVMCEWTTRTQKFEAPCTVLNSSTARIDL